MKKNKKKAHKKLTIFSRFIYILTHFDFLKILIKEKNSKNTWQFWFFWNSVFALILTFSLFFSVYSWEKNNFSKIPDFKFAIINGELSTNNIKDPLFIENPKESMIFVLDTTGKTFGVDILEKQKLAIFINKNAFFIKTIEAGQKKIQKIAFNSLKNDYLIEKSSWPSVKNKVYAFFISFCFLFFWTSLSLFRLLTAFFWAFLFWFIGFFLKIKDLTFMKTYLAVLNFSIITLFISIIFTFLFSITPYLTFLLLLILFGLNFSRMQRSKK